MKRTVKEIADRKNSRSKVTMLTAYDAGLAGMIDRAGIDMVLVGDSLGMVLLGYPSTVPVTMEQMLHHAAAVGRGVERALVVGDMPFLSYQVSVDVALANAGRFLKEARCDAVKLEGGVAMAETVAALVRAGIPVVGHIGLTPQTASQLGGYRVQGRDLDAARRILEDARALEDAGAFALVLECIPAGLAQVITENVGPVTIGIGAGAGCDGQVLVTHDLLGMFDKKPPGFVKKYVDLAPLINQALAQFQQEVVQGVFPGEEHAFAVADDFSHLRGEKP